ncbi:MAG: hypothetical protein AB1505_13815 [Candidatus Latescibacterota bacterium]
MRAEPFILELRSGWHLQCSSQVGAAAEVVSSTRFAPDSWYAADVPTTVLRALVRHGVYPDPRFGMNAFRIPDSSPEFNARHDLDRCSHLPGGRNPWRDPWWYRTTFALPALAPDQRVWLTLRCLNYRAEVWVNGRQVAGPEVLVGMFQRFRLDLTGQVAAGRNALAVRVHPVDHPTCRTPSSRSSARCASSTRRSAATSPR